MTLVVDALGAEQERALGLRLMLEAGIAMTPGSSMYMTQAGFFRIVFSAASPTAWPIALRRFEAFATAELTRS